MYIGIIGAMESEIALLMEKIKQVKVNKIGPFVYYSGEILEHKITLVQSLEGKVNSAIATQLMIENFDIDFVLNVGVAGGIHSKLKVGDIALSAATVEFDNNTTALGYALGYTFGINKVAIECNENLLKRMYQVSKEKVNTVVGVIASSDTFVEDAQTKHMLREKFDAIAVDMETAAINHVCAINHVDFCAIRAISDSGNSVEFRTFLEKALDSINQIIMDFLKTN